LIDKTLSLLKSSDTGDVDGAATILAAIPLGDQTEQAIDKLLPLLKSSDSDVQEPAIRALAAISTRSTRAAEIANNIVPLLKSDEERIQEAAALALSKIPTENRSDIVRKGLLDLFESSDDAHVLGATTKALAMCLDNSNASGIIDIILERLGPSEEEGAVSAITRGVSFISKRLPPGQATNKFLPLLRSTNWRIQRAAIVALSHLDGAENSAQLVDKLLPMLQSSSERVREAAAAAFARIPLGDHAGKVIDQLLPLLRAPVLYVRTAALVTLSKLPLQSRADVVIDNIVPLLGSEGDVMLSGFSDAAPLALAEIAKRSGIDRVVGPLLPIIDTSKIRQNDAMEKRAAVVAANTLAALPAGGHADQAFGSLFRMLNAPDYDMQAAAARALSALFARSERVNQVTDSLLEKLGASDSDEVLEATLKALAAISPGINVNREIRSFLPLLSSASANVQKASAQALVNTGPGGALDTIGVLSSIYNQDAEKIPTLRAIAHIMTGADEKKEGSEVLLAWLGKPQRPPLDSVADNPNAAYAVIRILDQNWPAISSNVGLRQEAEGRVIEILHAACSTQSESQRSNKWLSAAFSWIQDKVLEGQ
jgi:HEAT repeat protein